MAKKQTLKSLLGGGDGRVQASLNLGTPKLQPTIGRGGQSVTATQGTLRADQTQLGMLASSLEKLNPALQAYRKGYYAEAEKDKMLFKEKFAGMDDAERQALVQAQEANLAATEDSINAKLRGQYGLNPLAGIYAEKLVGASMSTEYNKFIAEQLEKKKREIEQLPWEKRPTAADMETFISDLTQQYLNTGSKDGGVLFENGTLRYQGFMASTAAKREELKLTIPKSLEDHHKDTVFIPNLATNIRNVALDISELEAVDGTQPNNKRARLNTYLRYLDTLDIADTQKVLTDMVEGFAVEDADFAREALGEVAENLKIGNEPFKGSKLYNDLLQKIDAKEDAWKNETKERNTEIYNEYVKQYKPELYKIRNGEFDEKGNYIEGTGGLDAVNAYIRAEVAKIRDDKDLPQEVKNSLIGFFENEASSLERMDDNMRSNMAEYYTEEVMATNISNEVQIQKLFGEVITNTNTGFTEANNPLFKQIQGLSATVLQQLPTDDAIRIVGVNKEWLTASITNLEKEALRMNLPSTEARAKWVMNEITKKGGIRDQFNERVKQEFNQYFNEKQAAYNAQKEADEKIAQELAAAQAATDFVQDPDNRLNLVESKRNPDRFDTSPMFPLAKGVFYQPERFLNDIITKYGTTVEYVKQGGEGAALLGNAYRSIYNRAKDELPYIVDLYNNKDAGNREGDQKKRIKQDYYVSKAFVGYEAQDLVEIIETGATWSALYDENGISYPKDYFEKNIGVIRIDGLAKGDEATTVLAALLGISVDDLIKSQKDYRNKFRVPSN